MNDDASDGVLEAYIDSAAALHGLTLTAEWRPGVQAHLKTITAASRLLLDFPLDDEVEAAPIFQP